MQKIRKIIYGKNNVYEAIARQELVEAIYISERIKYTFHKSINIKPISIAQMQELTNANEVEHENIAAKIIDFKYYNFDEIKNDDLSKVIILDHVKKNQNLGTIIRSANAFGFTHIFMSSDQKDVALVTMETIIISRGGLNNIKIVKVPSLEELIKDLKTLEVKVYATALNEKAKALGTFKAANKMAIVVGNEANGISANILALADEVVFIEMFGSVQSLNVSVALGITLFELTKK